MNFVQLYDYVVVSTRKYRHIILKGTNYKKLKSYQFFFAGNVKKLESKNHNNKRYVRASVLPSMKKMPYRVVIEFCALLALALLDLDYKARESVILSEEFFSPWKTFPGEAYHKTQSL